MGYQPGPVEYKREFSLVLLIVLVILCWPAALIYYFTRPKVPVATMQPTYAPTAAAPAATMTCPTCGKPATFIQQYNRYYCQAEQKYI